jgi:hypothetical protein
LHLALAEGDVFAGHQAAGEACSSGPPGCVEYLGNPLLVITAFNNVDFDKRHGKVPWFLPRFGAICNAFNVVYVFTFLRVAG